MITLTTPRLSSVLDSLSTAAAMAPGSSPLLSQFSVAEQERLMRSKTDYLGFYRTLKDQPLAISREAASLLYVLARSCNAQIIVEFGTSFGMSALHLAAAIRDNGGGVLITTECEPSKVAQAQANLEAAGLDDLVEIWEGDALHTLAGHLPSKIDLLLLDGAKGLYLDILKLVEGHLQPGSLVIADDTEYSPAYLAHVRTPANGYLSVALPEGMELSMCLQ